MASQWELENVGVAEIDDIDRILRRWEGSFGTATGFASGDLGWALREGYEAFAPQMRSFRSNHNDVGAIGFVEGTAAIWMTIDPAHLMDRGLAESIALALDEQGFREVSVASTPALVRRALAARGYTVDPSTWVHLWKPLTDDDVRDQPLVFATSIASLIQERVAVQQSAFEKSTFNVEKWNKMAAGPSFVPELDLVAVNEEGRGVSALTAWLPGPDACGMVEPMGTHADYRRQGHGLRVLRACFSELRKLGASGVRVYTPRENEAAVATYQAAGFLVINLDTTMVKDIP